MPLTITNVRQVAYSPELLPDAQIKDIPANDTSDPAVLDIRRFSPKWVQIKNIATEQNSNVLLKIDNERDRFNINTAGLKDRDTSIFNVRGKDFLLMNLQNNSGGLISDYKLFYSMLVFNPTIADKLLENEPLTSEEQEISEKYNLEEEVKKGILPLSFENKVSREYNLIDGKRTLTFDGTVTGSVNVVETFPAALDEIIVLESIHGTSAATAAENARIQIDRDDTSDYVEVPVFPLSSPSIAVNIPCFIPATRELRVKIVANTGTSAAMSLRYTIARYRLTDILKVRFGLVERGEVPLETFEKVKAGIL